MVDVTSALNIVLFYILYGALWLALKNRCKCVANCKQNCSSVFTFDWFFEDVILFTHFEKLPNVPWIIHQLSDMKTALFSCQIVWILIYLYFVKIQPIWGQNSSKKKNVKSKKSTFYSESDSESGKDKILPLNTALNHSELKKSPQKTFNMLSSTRLFWLWYASFLVNWLQIIF